MTTYSYDNADRLLSEVRTGTKPYSGSYTYDDAGRRLTALVITNGVTTHNGTYSYDGAGRLLQVADSATSLTENYVWNADGTLASYPGPGYTRLLEYDEEGRLVKIKRDFGGGNISTAYEYGYGYDGGRRWRKDYLQNQWTWYPCGVACSAGELVEQQSNLTGATWTTVGQQLRIGSGCSSILLKRNAEVHHADLTGSIPLISDSNSNTISSNTYDVFKNLMSSTGAAGTPCRFEGRSNSEENLLSPGNLIPSRGITTNVVAGIGFIDALICGICVAICKIAGRKVCLESCIALGACKGTGSGGGTGGGTGGGGGYNCPPQPCTVPGTSWIAVSCKNGCQGSCKPIDYLACCDKSGNPWIVPPSLFGEVCLGKKKKDNPT